MPSQTFKSKRHDTAISIPLTLTPPPGVTWDLNTAGVVAKFIARLAGAASAKVRANATKTGAWTLEYSPVDVDVDTVGDYDCEVEVTLGNGKKVTFPTAEAKAAGSLTWSIVADVDNL